MLLERPPARRKQQAMSLQNKPMTHVNHDQVKRIQAAIGSIQRMGGIAGALPPHHRPNQARPVDDAAAVAGGGGGGGIDPPHLIQNMAAAARNV